MVTYPSTKPIQRCLTLVIHSLYNIYFNPPPLFCSSNFARLLNCGSTERKCHAGGDGWCAINIVATIAPLITCTLLLLCASTITLQDNYAYHLRKCWLPEMVLETYVATSSIWKIESQEQQLWGKVQIDLEQTIVGTSVYNM
jgi:hypothetical protein